MKILLIGDTTGNPDEGMKKVSHRLKEYLNKIEDCEVFFASLIEAVKNREKFKEVDIIHFMGGPSWRTFMYSNLLKIIFNKRNLVSIISFIHPHKTFLFGISFYLFKPNAVIIQTQKWNNYVEKHIKNISKVPLAGIKCNKFYSVSKSEKSKLRNELGLPQNKIIVLHVGHLNEGRNLKVLNQLNNEEDIYPIVIVSSTVSPDQNLLNNLTENGVTVIREYIPQIDKYYKSADCYIFTTTDYNCAIQIPLSVIEALACQIPVITTKFEALPFYFPEHLPLLNYIDNFENLSSIIRHVYKNTDIIPDMKQNFAEEWDWGNTAKKLFKFYNTILIQKNE